MIFIETNEHKIYEVEEWRLDDRFSGFYKIDSNTYNKLCVEKSELSLYDVLFRDINDNVFLSSKAILLWYEE